MSYFSSSMVKYYTFIISLYYKWAFQRYLFEFNWNKIEQWKHIAFSISFELKMIFKVVFYGYQIDSEYILVILSPLLLSNLTIYFNFEPLCNWRSYINQLTQTFIQAVSRKICIRESIFYFPRPFNLLLALSTGSFLQCSISPVIFSSSYFVENLQTFASYYCIIVNIIKDIVTLRHPFVLGNDRVSPLRGRGGVCEEGRGRRLHGDFIYNLLLLPFGIYLLNYPMKIHYYM